MQIMLINAFQLTRPRTFVPIQIPAPQLPAAGDDRILVRTAYGLVCGSDIAFFAGNKPNRSYPMLPGAPVHECVGEVVESASERFQPGDLVVAIPDENKGLAELFLAQASRSATLNPDLDDPGAACLIQPLSTVLNAMDRLEDIQGKSFAVLGLGSIGLLFCWIAAMRGAGPIVGIDPCAYRCRLAETMSAAQTFCRRGIELVRETRQVKGEWNEPDICVEAVGHQTDTVKDCLELVKKFGTVLAFGVPDQEVYPFEYETFFRKNINLMASVTPDWPQYLAKARDLYMAHREELSKLVTHRIPIRDVEKGFRMYERREDGIIKALIDTTSW
jgi:threonine dehydrogenase-like Zn-dependent dehydrogenase